MSSALDYFKKVYDVVPGWVQKMHDYNPDMLTHYTSLRGAAMAEGVLSVKEKDILLVAMNEARHYERSMVYHTKGAIDGGATLEELAEYLLVGYIVGGEQSLQIGLKSFEYALQLLQVDKEFIAYDSDANTIAKFYGGFAQTEESKAYFDEVASFFNTDNENALTEKLLQTNVVTTELKHLAMTGIYTVQLKNKETDVWASKARAVGVEESQLAELGYICLLTAGIPSWFELSDALIEK